MEYPPIYIICYKNDYFLTQIAVSSIRYYYPKIGIFLLKDKINGDFSTKDLEKLYDVKIVNLGKKKFGWTSAKVFLLLSQTLKHKKVFLMDSDVVFVGHVLDTIVPYLKDNDFIVSPEYKDKPGSADFSNTYYDYNYFKKIYPNLGFPGFTFNTGNILITPGLIKTQEIINYFNEDRFPYWTSLGQTKLPTRDQSLLNIILALRIANKKVKLKPIEYMWWYRDKKVSKISINSLKTGQYPYLIHWAGATRSRYLPNIDNFHILRFFQHLYYQQKPLGELMLLFNLTSNFFSHFHCVICAAVKRVYHAHIRHKNIR